MEGLKNLSDEYKVVVIENSKFAQRNLKALMDKYFKSVYVTDNWVDGFKRMKTSTPNILIADSNIPGVDNGLDLIRKIKRIDHNIEIIIVSAHYDTANLLEALHIGVTDFIPKPINYNLLHTAMQKALNNLHDNKNISAKVSAENKTIYEILLDIKDANSSLEFINYYKGVPIIRPGRIHDIDDKVVEVEVDQLQLKAIAYERFTAIESNEVDKSFVAKVMGYNQAKSTVKLKDFKSLEYSPKRRAFVRVVPDDDFLLIVLMNNVKYDIIVNDISAKSISFNVNKDRNLFQVDNPLTLNMALVPKKQTDKTKVIIKCPAKVYQTYPRPEGLNVVATFELDDKLQKDLNNYIYERELELITEFKKLELKSKK